MPISDTKLTLAGNAELLDKFAGDFEYLCKIGVKDAATNRKYIISSLETDDAERVARRAALGALGLKKLVKKAFDTRRIDQEIERNPRSNLQYWTRSQEFIDEEVQGRLNIFSKLMGTLKNIKTSYGTSPEWHESYSRVLFDNVERILRLKIGDQDIYTPQLSYLEQLLFARYRLTLDQIKTSSDAELGKIILAKDENLLKRGAYLLETGGFDKKTDKIKSDGNYQPAATTASNQIILDGNFKTTQQNIVEAIFGNNDLRKGGERSVERTITITIRDEAKD